MAAESASPEPTSPARCWAVIAGGGTAGHLLPGLAVAEALVAAGHARAAIHFVGSDRGVEARLVPDAGFTLDELPGRGIQRRLTLANVGAALGIVRGLARAFAILRRRRPAVVVALGGHASVACALAAVVLRVPIVILEQNVRAGAANRLIGRFARAAAVSFDGTDLPRATVTGNPLRPEIRAVDRARDRRVAREQLELPVDAKVVAVFSGSLGSRQINEAVRGAVPRWAHRNDLAIRHVVGTRDYDDYVRAAPQPAPGGLTYQVVRYEDRMALLLAAADLAVTRSGGGVAELAAVGLPAVLVPLPIATRDHQTANARALAAVGAAVVVADHDLTTERLVAEVEGLLDDPHRLEAMAAAMAGAARPDAAERVAALVEAQARG
ncbi:MAG: UDP-N-acetylglucosamine--N-acetylmuramyl-(pentapeptide) pyrophosphoryl-undecaprenol [Acidimicrobiales bacterium]|nr:UDP-N-acetylglucosamine--N-acetylmuramyl-(pentapeptide) pyrophosphoryl-undecaprenol [Acidimicrobiales bacterium]